MSRKFHQNPLSVLVIEIYMARDRSCDRQGKNTMPQVQHRLQRHNYELQ